MKDWCGSVCMYLSLAEQRNTECKDVSYCESVLHVSDQEECVIFNIANVSSAATKISKPSVTVMIICNTPVPDHCRDKRKRSLNERQKLNGLDYYCF